MPNSKIEDALAPDFLRHLLGRNLAEYRKKRGLTQEALASRLGYNRRWITIRETTGIVTDDELTNVIHAMRLSDAEEDKVYRAKIDGVRELQNHFEGYKSVVAEFFKSSHRPIDTTSVATLTANRDQFVRRVCEVLLGHLLKSDATGRFYLL